MCIFAVDFALQPKQTVTGMLHTIYFIYGLCVMFYFMMSWLFFDKDKELLSRLRGSLDAGYRCAMFEESIFLSNP